MKKKLIAGNWKMNGSFAANEALVRAILPGLASGGCTVAVCVPAPYLAQVSMLRTMTDLELGAQDVSVHEQGAFTGEVSAAMLHEVGAYGTLVAHSERRQWFGETDESAAARVRTALAEGLDVIACVGETLAEREAGETEAVLRRQVGVLEHDDNLVIAYEPVWAIGTGKTATPAMAQEAHETIKSLLDVPVLYGGSVKPENAAELLAQPAVDGALVGGASLDVDSFAAICRAAVTS